MTNINGSKISSHSQTSNVTNVNVSQTTNNAKINEVDIHNVAYNSNITEQVNFNNIMVNIASV